MAQLVFLPLMLGLSLYPILSFASEDWRLDKANDQVEVYLRDYPGSNIPEFKAITQIPASMASILAVLLDVAAYPEWVHQCRKAETLAIVSDREQYIYQVNDLPFARDRDIILQAKLEHRNQGRDITIELEASPNYCEHNAAATCSDIEENAYVPIVESTGSYRMKQLDANTVEVTWRQYLDPGGKLPVWLIRALMADIPLKTLDALHDMVEQPEYRNSKLLIRDGSLHLVNPESN